MNTLSLTKSKQHICLHCKNDFQGRFFKNENDEIFCCKGCLSVYEIIKNHNLQKFYELAGDTKLNKNSEYSIRKQEYDYLDSDAFLEKHIVKDINNNNYQLSFYLEGIHCLGCLWLIEKLNEIIPELKTSRLNLGKSTVKVIGSSKISFSDVAYKLHSLGYKPHPILEKEDHLKFRKSEERLEFLRLGVAAFCALNIMLYSVSNYSGASGIWKTIFEYFNFALALPIVFFSAVPFYKSAWSATKNKIASIDTPIAIAVISGFLVSVTNLYLGGHQYFDSITTLIFFLLLSRVIQRTFQMKHLNQNDLSTLFSRSNIKKWNKVSNLFEFYSEKNIEIDDLVKIDFNEIIPFDGIIYSGQTNIQMAVLTGEPIPILKKENDEVFAGTINVGEEFILKVKKSSSDTKLANILKEVANNQKNKAPISTYLEKVSSIFIKFVFVLAAITFVYFLQSTTLLNAIERSLTLLIVTCPCALALATPLAFSKALNICKKNKLIVKDETVFEKANKIQNIFLDKTGTITEGKFQVISWQEIKNNKMLFNLQHIVYQMEKNSKHPLAKSIISYLDSIDDFSKNIKNLEINEILGIGVKATYFDKDDKNNFELLLTDENKTNSATIKTLTLLDQNGIALLKIDLQDSIQKSNISVFSTWRNKYNLSLISGDNLASVKEIAKILFIDEQHIFSNQSPKDKSKIISENDNTLMIGDGANDTLAFTKASLSIAVYGSVEASLKTADIFCLEKGLQPIQNLFIISKEIIKVIKRNIIFSIAYNIIAILLVFSGEITPLIAAILMPISSLSVILSTIIGTKNLNKLNIESIYK